MPMALTARQYFSLRRLHSLTGVVPVGVFLAEHFFTNSFALQGAQSYNDKVGFLKSIPYLYLVELFGIAVPIAFHAVLGLWIFWEAKMNSTRLPYKQNFMFTLQRVTGVFLVFYIGYHVAVTRFGQWFGYQNQDLFALMKHHLENPLVAIFYVLGILAASFHLGNGLWGFALHWGLITEHRSQKRWAWAAIGVSVALALVGLNSLLAFGPFGLRPVRIFSEPHLEQVSQHADHPLNTEVNR
jgi:succinate dehydrogenase / fumarate reductase, cytochrome b subunit